jgi:BirA family biotin operon repressor/biotin-[acetyl-CoA-carboxylase] ligase
MHHTGPFTIRDVAETESTNDDALALLGRPDGAGVVLVADYQRAGRGRRARAWVAPPGSSLLFTTVLPRAISRDALRAVTFWTALGVADGIEAATGLRVSLQWPNDLLIAGRKCCGILCVSRVSGDDAWVACGTGINVRRPADDPALAAIEPPPAFLSDSMPGVERKTVLDAILAAYAARLDAFDDPDRVARDWERRAGLDGTPYRLLVDGESEPFDAVARRLDPDGSLVVEHAGVERRISLADARVLRC